MRRIGVGMAVAAVIGLLGLVAGEARALDSIGDLEAVDADGVGTHPDLDTLDMVTFQGVVLNAPGDMLNTATQWQMYVQALDGSGGIALYANAWYCSAYNVWPRYSTDWLPGDIVEVTGLIDFYNGKTNLNERHDPDNVFTVTLISHGSVPDPILIPSVAACTTFDQTRTTGGELYQGQWTRLEGVWVESGTWANGQTLTITDTSAGELAMLLSSMGDFTQGEAPSGKFNVTAIFDQEDTAAPYTGSYRLWPLAYDQIEVWGDADLDGAVEFEDYQALAAHFGLTTGATWEWGDFDGDGDVDFNDYQELAVNFGYGVEGGLPASLLVTPVPEPATLALLGAGAVLALRRRWRKGVAAAMLLALVIGAVGASDARASIVTFDLQAADGQWQVWATVSSDCAGLDSFDFDVTTSGALAITSSVNEAPQSDNGLADLFGFYKFRSDGTAGEGIHAAQDSIYGDTYNATKDARVLQDVGLAGGSRVDLLSSNTITWEAPVLLASGTYTGTTGSLLVSGSCTVLQDLGDGWTGPGSLAMATVTGDVAYVRVPATLALVAAGLGAALARRRGGKR